MMKTALKNIALILLPACLSAMACNQPANKTSTTSTMTDSISHSIIPPSSGFEKTIDSKQTHLYTLKSRSGIIATLTNYGAHLVSLAVPDKNGKLIDVVVGFDNIDGY